VEAWQSGSVPAARTPIAIDFLPHRVGLNVWVELTDKLEALSLNQTPVRYSLQMDGQGMQCALDTLQGI